MGDKLLISVEQNELVFLLVFLETAVGTSSSCKLHRIILLVGKIILGLCADSQTQAGIIPYCKGL